MNVRYVRIKSWHVLLATPAASTLCGRRTASTETSETLPAGKSCETCARLLIWREERERGAR